MKRYFVLEEWLHEGHPDEPKSAIDVFKASDVEALKAGAVERIAQYMEAYEGYQGDYSLTVGKRIFALIFEEGK